MQIDECRRRFASATVARLATVTAAGAPHLVPVSFALLAGDTLVSAVDRKPKRTTALRRLENIVGNPAVSLLVDHYEDDWARLWWVRVDGRASVRTQVDGRALGALTARYPRYRDAPPPGPLIVVEVERFVGWSAS